MKLILRSFGWASWVLFLTFPLMGMKINTLDNKVDWFFDRLLWTFVLTFLGTILFSLISKSRAHREEQKRGEHSVENSFYQFSLKAIGSISDSFSKLSTHIKTHSSSVRSELAENPRRKKILTFAVLVLLFAIPLILPLIPGVSNLYWTKLLVNALVYVMLGLGLNVVVGMGGILNLGYIAFYLVGAYTYAILNHNFGINFWIALPLGGILSMLVGILISLPILRLRGDYLAIVTLAFGEIVRNLAINWSDLTGGPSGIARIDRPDLFGFDVPFLHPIQLTYFITLTLTLLTIVLVIRLKDSRVGRALLALREDEVASQAMGISTTKSKVTAFAIGAFIAGIAGVIFAGTNTTVDPKSFQLMGSVNVLIIVVLGGMGSIPGTIFAAPLVILLPEVLRAFNNYRQLTFGALLVVMMRFKPNGLIPEQRKEYTLKQLKQEEVLSE
jgi:branched-chain amino acid transport system permease protein